MHNRNSATIGAEELKGTLMNRIMSLAGVPEVIPEYVEPTVAPGPNS